MLPVTLGVIVVLFAIQRRGTERVGRLFGPIMILWFVALAVLGAMEIVQAPQVLAAVNPWYALQVVRRASGPVAGHPRRRVPRGDRRRSAVRRHGPLRPQARCAMAWLVLVWPALLINYFGQGALLLQSTAPIANPFYALAPQALLPALVLLSTAATVIASQATISGAFSVTREAVQLDLLPRVRVLQTSAEAHGPDLRAGREPVHVRRGGAVRGRLRQLERAVGRLRRVGGGHHAHHHLVRRAGRAARCGTGRCGASPRCSASCCSSTWPSSPATPPRSRAAAGCRSRWRA